MAVVRSPEVAITQIAACVGRGEPLADVALRAVDRLGDSARGVGSVVAATFSNQDRFPSLAVRVASSLGLPMSVPAFDIQMACSAYPYALYAAGRLAADTHLPSLVIDGDVQSPLVDASDHATGEIFSDAVTATIVTADAASPSFSPFSFLTRHDASALSCPAAGPIKMDGFGVFTFVATEVSEFLREFLAEAGMSPDMFAPHQANPYMVRQLAKSLGLSDRLLAIDDSLKNPGSCSVAMALAAGARPGTALVAGFGAGLSAAAGIVRIADGFKGVIS
jgi:3-oxoacyl-[acyl-carrier-protein] synthase-3